MTYRCDPAFKWMASALQLLLSILSGFQCSLWPTVLKSSKNWSIAPKECLSCVRGSDKIIQYLPLHLTLMKVARPSELIWIQDLAPCMAASPHHMSPVGKYAAFMQKFIPSVRCHASSSLLNAICSMPARGSGNERAFKIADCSSWAAHRTCQSVPAHNWGEKSLSITGIDWSRLK